MLKAKEARKLKNDFLDEEIKRRREKAMQFCKTEIEPQIRKKCMEFIYSQITVTNIDKKIFHYVIEILKDCGYTVQIAKDKTEIIINWWGKENDSIWFFRKNR